MLDSILTPWIYSVYMTLMVSTSNFDQGDVGHPVLVMTCGVNWSENDCWTFGGSDETTGHSVDVTEVVEVVVVDEMPTHMVEH